MGSRLGLRRFRRVWDWGLGEEGIEMEKRFGAVAAWDFVD